MDTGILFLASTIIIPVVGFNIDIKNPIVITNHFNGPDSHFGASVKLIPAATKSGTSGPSGWIFIGAPKGNSTHLNHFGIKEPGVIWRCTLSRNKKDACRIMHMDPTGEYDPKNKNWAHQDRKDGAWIGGTFAVGGNRFVTCGSRWVNKKFTNWHLMNGICYWASKSNVMANFVNETWPWLSSSEHTYRLLGPIKSENQTFSIRHSDGSVSEGFDWGLSQMGFSLDISKNGRELIAGAPGVYDWTGSIVMFKDSTYSSSELHQRLNARHPTNFVFSDMLGAKVKGIDDMDKILSPNSYFGYSVAAGNFFDAAVSQGRSQFAAGAPRSGELHGSVLIFSLRETRYAQTATLDLLTNPITLADESVNSGYASYFGSTILAININGDPFDDLIVGAPQFSIPMSENAEAKSKFKINFQLYDEAAERPSVAYGDEGCVFIFKSSGVDFEKFPQTLCGDKVPGAKFGSSIISIEDVNHDGFLDFAVGAPYENGGRGAVYIYHGGWKAKFAQKISAVDFDNLNLRGFGYSMSAADIDDNGYPDLAIGAYQSNAVIILRAVPVVKFNSSIVVSIPKVKPETYEFNVSSCISFDGVGVTEALGIWVKIELLNPPKPGTNSTERIVTWISQDDQPSVSNVSNLLQPISTIQHLLVYPKKGSCYHFQASKMGKLDDSPKSVVIRKTFWIDDKKTTKNHTRNVKEILSDSSGNPVVQVQFEDPDHFHEISPLSAAAQLVEEVTTVLPVGTVCEADGNPSCEVDLDVRIKVTDSEGVDINSSHLFLLGSSDFIFLDVIITNRRELALLPANAEIEWSTSLRLRQASSNCEKVFGKVGSYHCPFSHPLYENQTEQFKFQFDMTDIFWGEGIGNNVIFLVSTITTSEQLNKQEHKIEMPIAFETSFVNYSFKDTTSLASNFHKSSFFQLSQPAEIALIGPTSVYTARLEMSIPTYFLKDSKRRKLTIIKEPIVTYDGDAVHCSIFGDSDEFFEDQAGSQSSSFVQNQLNNSNNFYLNSLINTEGQAAEGDELGSANEDESSESNDYDYNLGFKIRSAKIRQPRSVVLLQEMRDVGKTLGFVTHYNDLIFSCTENYVKCVQVRCDLKYFRASSKAVVEFKFKLQNGVVDEILNVFRENEHQSIIFKSNGSLRAVNTTGVPTREITDVRCVTRILLPERSTIPLSIILLAVCGGIILLTVITTILIKCGFFRRKDKEKLEQLKAVTNRPDAFFQ